MGSDAVVVASPRPQPRSTIDLGRQEERRSHRCWSPVRLLLYPALVSARVTVIGSCRVWTPFHILEKEGRVSFENTGVYGFTHYAKEALQQLKVMRGEQRIPRSLAPYISHKVLPSGGDAWVDIPLYDLSRTDLLVIEISSLKEIEFDGYFLQINRLREQLVGDEPLLVEWWRELYDKERSRDRRRFLSVVPRSVERNIVMFVDVAIQDQESLLGDMQGLVSSYNGPVVFVSHFDTPTFEGEQIELRNRLARYVEENSASLGKEFFNPRLLIEGFGQRQALKDLAHYTEEFERVLAECFYVRFVKPLEG